MHNIPVDNLKPEICQQIAMTKISPEMPQPLTIWCLSDGRPGHYNQTKGLLKALAHIADIRWHWIEIKLRSGSLSRPLLRSFLKFSPQLFSVCAKAFYRMDFPPPKPDLVISTGGNTIFLNVDLAKAYHCKNIFIGRLHGVNPKHFTAYLTIKKPDHPNAVHVDLAPTEIDKTEIDHLAKQAKDHFGLSNDLWLIAIGGDSGIYNFFDGDWVNLAYFMNQVAEKRGIKWLLTTSRRTGNAAESILQKHINPNILADAVWYSDKSRDVMRTFIAAASIIVCTEDSFTMLTESASSGKPVISLRPSNVNYHEHYDYALSNLIESKLVKSLPLSDYRLDQLATQIAEIAPIEKSVSAIIADQIRPYM